MSKRNGPRLKRIQALEQAYSSSKLVLPCVEERIYLLRDVVASLEYDNMSLTKLRPQCDLGSDDSLRLNKLEAKSGRIRGRGINKLGKILDVAIGVPCKLLGFLPR
jgi:hypothetical protein